MKKHPLRLLAAYFVLAALLLSGVGCASSGTRSHTATAFGPVQTGSYIPRQPRQPATQSSTRKIAKTKRQKSEKTRRRETAVEPAKPAADRPADEDYVTRGGFR